jgi:hypothetical protein
VEPLVLVALSLQKPKFDPSLTRRGSRPEAVLEAAREPAVRRTGRAASPRIAATLRAELRARKLHKQLHTHRTFGAEQVDLNEKLPTCRAFAEPSTDSNRRPPYLL